jgi:hypothetical protein
MPTDNSYEPSFEPTAEASTFSMNGNFAGVNVCRIAALSSSLDPDSFRSLRQGYFEELRALGFGDAYQNAPASTPYRRAELPTPEIETWRSIPQSQLNQWENVRESLTYENTISFLISMLGSANDRESISAAVALWLHLQDVYSDEVSKQRFHIWQRIYKAVGKSWFEEIGIAEETESPTKYWPRAERRPGGAGDEWGLKYLRLIVGTRQQVAVSQLISLVSARIAEGKRSDDNYVSSLSDRIFPESPFAAFTSTNDGVFTGQHSASRGISTIIHGTAAWPGTWWQPGGNFHAYILRNCKNNLYNKPGTAFSWNGALRDAHRRVASDRFKLWAMEIADNKIDTLLAHSFGGEVAARAILNGTRVEQLTLLSVPITDDVVRAAEHGIPIVDVRVRLDPVLALLRVIKPKTGSGRLTNVTKVDIGWGWHDASHNPKIWDQYSIGEYLP